eukprot:766078-Hanusia_phi.AAC.2
MVFNFDQLLSGLYRLLLAMLEGIVHIGGAGLGALVAFSSSSQSDAHAVSGGSSRSERRLKLGAEEKSAREAGEEEERRG